MKFILLFLISLPVYSNSFQLDETSARFKLSISKDKLYFHSESLKTDIALRPCSFPIAKALNNQLISKLPRTFASSGLKFKIDNNEFFLSEKDELAKIVLSMEHKILQFMAEEKTACK